MKLIICNYNFLTKLGHCLGNYFTQNLNHCDNSDEEGKCCFLKKSE